MPPLELEEVPMPIVGGLDIHRKQLTFDYLDTETGEVKRGQIAPADRAHLRAWDQAPDRVYFGFSRGHRSPLGTFRSCRHPALCSSSGQVTPATSTESDETRRCPARGR